MDGELKIIGHIKNDFDSKFGIPRQSGLVDELESSVIFTPPYRNPDAVRGLEGFSHIWLLWQFSKAVRDGWSPTVRPPRLGGNERIGVFATRSPYRPNAIGLSSVRLKSVEYTKNNGPVLRVLGADLMNGTPIYDIKPYLPYTDCHQDATGGFAGEDIKRLEVNFPKELLSVVQKESQKGLVAALSQDPRPAYQNDPNRIYGFRFAGCEVKFKVVENVLYVLDTFVE